MPGGVGGGNGGQTVAAPGGGAGLGGAIFINSGGTLTVTGTLVITGATVVAGTGSGAGGNGAAAASAIFSVTGNPLNFSPPTGVTITINGDLGDDSSTTLPGGTYTAGNGSGNALTKNGVGTLVLNGTNTYVGGTTINNGQLTIGGGGIATGDLTFGTGTTIGLDISGISASSLTVKTLAGGDSQTTISLGSKGLSTNTTSSSSFNGIIQGTGNLTKAGSGTLVLGGSSTYSGGTTLSGGAIQIAADSGIGNTAGTFTLNGGTLNTTAIITTPRPILISSGTIQIDASSLTLSGTISGSGGFTKSGTGSLIFSGANNTYSGTTTLATGILQAGTANSFSPNSIISNSTTVDLNNLNQTSGLIFGSGNVTLGSGNLTMSKTTNTATTFTHTGTISGTGGVTISMPGASGDRYNMYGTNTYSGGTTLTTAQLGINQDANFGAASTQINVTGNSTLFVGAAISIPRNIVFSNNSRLTVTATVSSLTFPSSMSGTGALSLTGSFNSTVSGPWTFSATTFLTLTTGTVTLTNTNILSSASILNLGASSILNLNGFDQEVASLTSSAATTLRLNGATLTCGANNATSTASGLISGPGTLVKKGTGGLTLSNTSNSQTTTVLNSGTISISSSNSLGTSGATFSVTGNGTLRITATISNMSQPVTLASNTLTIDTQSFALTATNTLSGAGGGITKIGSGSLILTGSNSYTGTTQVSGGTLQAGTTSAFPLQSAFVLDNTAGVVLDLNNFNSSIASLSGGGTTGGNVTLGSATLTLGSDNTSTTYSGAISGTGGITKVGTGTFILAGTSTYSGGTILSSGTLQIANDAFLGNSSGTLTFNGGTLQVTATTSSSRPLVLLTTGTIQTDSGITLTSTSTISGSSLFVKSGAGTMTSSIDNGSATFSTTISGGSLVLTGAAALPATGSVSVTSGTFDMSGVSNGMTIGDLSSGSGGTFNLGNKHLQFGSSGATTFAGILTGLPSGTISKVGSGSINVTGTISASDFNVASGTVSANGFITSPMTIQSAATLKGSGTISGNVTVFGNLTPGNSIGTLNIVGTLDLDNNSVTTIELNPTSSSLIAVTGTAIIESGATLQLNVTGGVPKSDPYTILTATNGVTTGCFTLIQPSGYTFSVTCLPNSVLLSLGSFSSAFSTNGLTGNQLAVANYLNSLSGLSFMTNVLRSLSLLSFSQLQQALNAISPSRNAFTSYITENTAFTVIRTANQRMANQRMRRFFDRKPTQVASQTPPERETLWAANTPPPLGKTQTAARKENQAAIYWVNLGEFLHEGAESQNPSFDSATGGFLLGGDYYGINNAMVGASSCYAHNWIYQEQGLGNANVDSVYLTGYATGYLQDFYLEGELLLGYNMFSNKRVISFPGFSANAKSDHKGWQLSELIEAGYDWIYENIVLEPFLSLGAATNFENSFKEHGADPLNMQQPSHNSTLLQLELGGNAYQIWEGDWGFISLKESLSYVYQKPFGTGNISANIVDAPGSFTVRAFKHAKNLVSPGLEVFYRTPQNAFLSFLYQGRFGSSYQSNDAVFKLGVFF
jgi:autotransporter-associated beta strand protein